MLAVLVLAILAFQVVGFDGDLFGQEAGESAQETAETSGGLIYQRKIQLPQGSALPAVVMTEFFTNGELAAAGSNLLVLTERNAVPWRILQLGPGDFCRLAFQTVPKQHLYKIYYGGKAQPEKPPAWTSRAGLLLETRHWSDCNLRSVTPCVRPSRRPNPLAPICSCRLPPVQSVLAESRTVPEPVRGNTADLRPGLYHFLRQARIAASCWSTASLSSPHPAGTGLSTTRGTGARSTLRGSPRIPVLARRRGCRCLHGGRLAASGIGQAGTDSSGSVWLRGDRGLPCHRREALARILGGRRRRGALGRKRLAAGPHSVSLGSDARFGLAGPKFTGILATDRPAR